jgi:GDPmannose 4,6-dehydratase
MVQEKIILGNLNIKRDFGYAPKYIEAMWLMLQQNFSEDFIICSGKSILLKDIVEYIFKKLNIDKDLIYVDENLFRPNEVYEIIGDNSKAKKILNWEYTDSFFDIIDILIYEEEKHYKKGKICI